MSRHRRELRMPAILARLGWQRDPALWRVPYLDAPGRRTELSVRLGAAGVTLRCPAPWPLHLTTGSGRAAAADLDQEDDGAEPGPQLSVAAA